MLHHSISVSTFRKIIPNSYNQTDLHFFTLENRYLNMNFEFNINKHDKNHLPHVLGDQLLRFCLLIPASPDIIYFLDFTGNLHVKFTISLLKKNRNSRKNKPSITKIIFMINDPKFPTLNITLN